MTPHSPRNIRLLACCVVGVIALSTAQLASAALPKFKPGAPAKKDTTKAQPAPPPASAPATQAAPAPTTTSAPAPTGNGTGVGAPATGAGAAAAGAAGTAGAAAAGTQAATPPANVPPPAAVATKTSVPLTSQERAALRTEIDRALRSMADSLKLSPTQRSKARPILLDHAYQVKQLRERYATQERTGPVIESMQRDLAVLRDTTDSKMSRVLHSDQMAAYMSHRDVWLNKLRTRMGVTALKPTAAQPAAQQPPAMTPPVVPPSTSPAHPAGTNGPGAPAGVSVPSHPAGVSARVDTTHKR